MLSPVKNLNRSVGSEAPTPDIVGPHPYSSRLRRAPGGVAVSVKRDRTSAGYYRNTHLGR